MHLFGNIGRRKVNNNFLFRNFRKVQALDKIVDFLLYESVVDLDLQESFFVSFDWANYIVFKVIFYNFFGELDYGFASQWSSLFFVFVHVKLFHGVWWNIFALVFGTILQHHLTLQSWERFLNDLLELVLDKFGDKFGLGLHFISWCF